jgi:hypothetical protein
MERPWEHVPSIRQYYARLVLQIISDFFGSARGHIVSAAIGIAAALISRQVGWIPKGGIVWTILVALIPYVGILLLVLIMNAIRAPVKLDNRRQAYENAQQDEIRQVRNR